MKGSSYLNSAPRRAVSKPRRFGSLAALLLVFAVLLSSFASTPAIDTLLGKAKPNQAAASTSVFNSASAIWCADPKEGKLGYGMDNQKDWKSGSAWYPHSDAGSRVLTAQEAFSNGVRFVNFDGVGESPGMPWFWISPSVGLPEKADNKDEKLKSVVNYTKNTPDADWYSNMNSSRTATNCVMGDAGTLVANGILGITNGITNLMGGISTFAFDPNFICEPNSGAKDCIDLVGIIGGSGKSSDSGIIGKLTSSVYFPLLALAALLVGIWIIINGLAKRQFRETFTGLLWSVIITILGIGILLNPLLLAKAPMVVGNAVTSCIVGAFSGSGACVSSSTGGSGSSSSDSTSTMCSASSSKGGFNNQAAITMASMSCELWKAFVLQPYAQGSFGAPLDQLDTKKSGTVANKLIAKNPGFKGKPDTFCVNTKVKGKLNSHFSNTLDLTSGGNKICNLAVYQAYLGVDAKVDGGDALPSANSIDGRWLKVAQVAATDEGMYRAWAPTDWHLAQVGYASIGLISAFLAAIVIFVVAAFALAFYITSLLMIAFAPFFLLAGVHPGKGRKMMIGWIGQVLSNIMKYIGSAIFLVIIVSIYGAVLANVTNPGAILIFMLILTVALLMYRREIIDMIGVIDLGGEKLSNKFAEKTMDRVKNTGKTAMAVGAGVTAGAISSGAMNPFNVNNWKPNNMARNMGDTLRAGNDSFRRSIKSRPGMVGEVLKASDRISSDNRADMATQARVANTEAERATKDKDNKKKAVDTLNEDLNTSNAEANEQIEDLGVKHSAAKKEQHTVERDLTKLESAESTALEAVTNPDFAAYQALLNELNNLQLKATIAEESGDLVEAEQLRNQAMSVENEMRAAERRMTEEEFISGSNQYNAALANALGDSNVDPETAESYSNHVRRQYEDVMSTLVGTQRRSQEIQAKQKATEESLTNSILKATEDLNEAELRERNTQNAAEMAQQNVIDLRPGQTVRNTRVRKNARKIEEMQNFRPDVVADMTSALNQENYDDENVVEDTVYSPDENSANNGSEETVSDVNPEPTAPQNNANSLIEQNRFKLDRLNEIKSDVSMTKSKVISDWQRADTEDPEGIARQAYVNSRIARAQGAEAESRIAALQSKERESGGLSEEEEYDFAAAQSQLRAQEEAFNNANRVMTSVGTDAKAMDEKFNKEALDKYSQTASGQRYTNIEHFERFEKQLGNEIGKVQNVISTEEQNQARSTPVDNRQATEQPRPMDRELPKLDETVQQPNVDYSQNQPSPKVEPVVDNTMPPIGRNVRDRQVDQARTPEQSQPQTQKVERELPTVEDRLPEVQAEQPQNIQPVKEMKRDEAPRVQSRRAEAPTPAPKTETPRVAPVLDQKDIAAKEENLKSIQREFEQKEQEAKNLNEKADEIFRNNQAEEVRLKANADEARNRAHSLNESSAGYDQAVERMNEEERRYRDSIQEMEGSYRDAQDRIEEAEKAKNELTNQYVDTDKEIRASRESNTVSANPTQRERAPKVTETPRATQNETKRVSNKENLDRIEGSSQQPSRSEMEKDLRQLNEKVRQAEREAQEAENKVRNMSVEADNLRSENKRKIVELENDLSVARSRDSYSSESKEALKAYHAAVEESEADIRAADRRLDEARRKSELLRSNVVANEDEYSIAKKRVQTARSVLDSDGPNFKDSGSRSSKKNSAGDFSAREMKAPGQEETLASDMNRQQGKNEDGNSNKGDNPFRGNPFKRK